MNKQEAANEIIERFSKNHGAEADLVVCVYDRTGGCAVASTAPLDEIQAALPSMVSGTLLTTGLTWLHAKLAAVLGGRG